MTFRSGPIYDSSVTAALGRAWDDSEPRTPAAHEEGGFVVRTADGDLAVVRWPRGQQNTILVPHHVGCRIGHDDIVASFHTHPNAGPAFLQEPSETDRRAVRD